MRIKLEIGAQAIIGTITGITHQATQRRVLSALFGGIPTAVITGALASLNETEVFRIVTALDAAIKKRFADAIVGEKRKQKEKHD
jgi:hypothetical protein